ncbi:MAG: hypothetical protein M9958_03300 [Chitinophagales bacterium]|nr:hypothetical protein [Chitinophagales bacterium]
MDNQIVKAKPTVYQMILEGASKYDLIEQYSKLTLSDIVQANYASIGALTRSQGKEQVRKVMAVLVSDLNTSFGGDMSKDEIIEAVYEIQNGISSNLSLEDLFLICSQLKRSHTYKLKVPIILKAVEQHLEERTQLIMQNNYNAHLSTKHNEDRKSMQNVVNDNAFNAFQSQYFNEQHKK